MSEQSKFASIDAAILAIITATPNCRLADVVRGARDLAVPHVTSKRDAYRVVDMRLQALRRSGRIEYRGFPMHWRIRNA